MSTRGLQFDDWQFQNHYQTHPVSVESKLSFDDYGRSMSTAHRAEGRAWVPPFATDGRQLKIVLLLRTWRFVHNGVPMPRNLDWHELNRIATERALKGHEIRESAPAIQKQIQEQHKAAVCRAGGYLQLQAAIAWRSWRLGQDSVTVAESLGVSPSAVRINLSRIKDAARLLAFDVGPPHHTRQNKRHAAALRAAWVRRRALGHAAA
jgi:hypothetical protein